ncbi:MAG: phosphoribosyltransferase family protein [Dermatophilaceae bacterium]
MFRDRAEAGSLLAALVTMRLGDPSRPVPATGALVLALPLGGVPVAKAVARALGAQLDVLVVRKIGAPGQPELALGAVGESSVVVLNADVVAAAGLGPDQVDWLIRDGSRRVEQIVAELRPTTGPPDPRARTVIVVDDGVATGATARAAAKIVRRRGASQVILAIPVGAPSTCSRLGACFDEVICLQMPWPFGSVGRHYKHFDQVRVDEVRRLLGNQPS